MSQQPFQGIRVIEFGQFVAVPAAAQLLADGGAEVIKVEPLTGDSIRFIRALGAGQSKFFISRNNGKQCLPLDLSNPLSKPVVDALLKEADVVLFNMRPGAAEKLGIAPQQLVKRFPRLIIGSVSGFGNAGPEAGDAGLDLVVQARSGLMANNGRVIDGRPAAIDSPATVDTLAGMTLAFGVSAALLRRVQTGLGGIVNTSLLQAAINMSSSGVCRSVDLDGEEHDRMLAQLAAKRAEGASYEEQVAASQPAERKVLKQQSNIYYTTYATKDSFVAIACGNNPLRAKLGKTLGVVDEALSPDFAGDYEAHYIKLAPQFRAAFTTQTTDHWVKVLREAGVPVSKVFLSIELFDDEQIRANKFLHHFDHYQNGRMTMLGSPLSLDDDAFRPGKPTVLFGSETEEILAKVGFSEGEIAEMVKAGITHRGL